MEDLSGTDCFQFRLSRPWIEVQPLITRLIDACECFVVYEHTHDNEVSRTHVHGVLVNCKWKEDTIRNNFMKVICPAKVDHMLSRTYKLKATGLRYPLDSNAFRYMSKGQYFLLQKGFSNDMLETKRAEWVPPATAAEKAEAKGTKARRIDMLQEMRALVGDRTGDVHFILKMIRQVLVKHEQVIGAYKIMDYHDSIMFYDDRSNFINRLAEKINSRF